ncbi:MAG: hypothetical protein ACI89X_004356, partial [Planctomycetota bacterium]
MTQPLALMPVWQRVLAACCWLSCCWLPAQGKTHPEELQLRGEIDSAIE